MNKPRTYADQFPRQLQYETTTYDGRRRLGFKGYEVVETCEGGWVLIATPGGHDSPHSLADQPA